MTNRLDIYGTAKDLERYKQRIGEDSEITPENKKAMLAFFDYCFSTGLSQVRVLILAQKLFYLSKQLKKDFKQATKEFVVLSKCVLFT